MHQYLNTIEGMNEIKGLSKILKEKNVQIDKKKAIYAIFRLSASKEVCILRNT
jgi:hypothetical protein